MLEDHLKNVQDELGTTQVKMNLFFITKINKFTLLFSFEINLETS